MDYLCEDENAAFLSSLKATRPNQSVKETRRSGTLSLIFLGLLLSALVIGGVSTVAYQQRVTAQLHEQTKPASEMRKVLGDCRDSPE